MDASVLNLLSMISFVLGLLSIVGSVGIWYMKKGDSPESRAYAERFGIFVGLWVPSFFGLAIYLKLLVTR